MQVVFTVIRGKTFVPDEEIESLLKCSSELSEKEAIEAIAVERLREHCFPNHLVFKDTDIEFIYPEAK